MDVAITRWAAWAPGLETEEDWRSWAHAPAPLEAEGVPDARFLPAMLRRRCTPLSKIMLKVAYECAGEEARSNVRTVFSSRHGSINESIALLENVVKRERISPAIFSHTVHNAQAGLFSIASGNREASSSLAARDDSFGCGMVEALCHLEREPERPVLLVVADVPLAATFAALIDEPVTFHGVALLLESGCAGPGFEMRIQPAEKGGSARLEWPGSVEFLRFWLSDDASVEIPTARHRWSFEKKGWKSGR
jgi:hypothetical protein